jgi:arabinose-5-phosphate isomerase
MTNLKIKIGAFSTQELLESARMVLTTESAALAALANDLGDAFLKALDIIIACKGRAVITGMGKSGHIARKIAATFASTGTPALFVHPGEASHGDLGMIVAGDIVIALSNSGEALELTDLINYTRRFSIPLIAITGGEKSSLGATADVTLLLPKIPEVCPMGLAPTTSTTMMIALGDALAVASMEAKGFTADDYRNFHPGGKLGKTLLRVVDLMHKDAALPVVREQDAMSDVLVVITQKALGCTAVIDGSGLLTGIITDGDLRRHMQGNLLEKKAADVMNPDPMTIAPGLLAAEATKLLNEKKRNQFLVVVDSRPVGVLHIQDLVRAGFV